MGYFSGLKQSKYRTVPIYSRRALEMEIKDFSLGINTRDDQLLIDDKELSNGQNIVIDRGGTISKKTGTTLYGNFLGTTTGILGLFNFVNAAGTQERLAVYDTSIYRDVAGTWTALTGATMTTNKAADGAYFPLTDKFYILNGTDAVVKYTSGASADQTDSSFKKGKYLVHFKNHLLVAGVSGQEDYIWYTDLGVDTFSANNYFRVEGEVTGLIVYYDVLLIFTKNKIYRLQNFTFDGVAAGPEAVFPLPVDFGTIASRTIKKVNNFIYFLGQSHDKKAHIYKTDGYKAIIVSDRIDTTMNGVATGQLSSACSGEDGKYYRLSVAESGQTTNNLEIVYDTARGIFVSFNRKLIAGRADYACYMTSETSGKWDIYAGTQGTGQVFELHQQNYEELAEERYLTLGSINQAIDSNSAKRAAQSFKLSNYNTTETITLTQLYLRLKKVAGTTTELTIRIETDSSGVPSGTLADDDATATISAFTDTSYLYKKVSFSGVTLSGNTTYWIVVQHTTEGSGSSQYAWSGDPCVPTYTNGNMAYYASGAWTADTGTDLNFVLYVQSAIDSYADSKLFSPAGVGKEFRLHKFMSLFSTAASYNAEIGISTGVYSTFNIFFVNLADTTAATWGGGKKWKGEAMWGGNKALNYFWKSTSGIMGRNLKIRVRNRKANQPFTFNGLRAVITRKAKFR